MGKSAARRLALFRRGIQHLVIAPRHFSHITYTVAWPRRLDFAPCPLRVTGTAGSGKTQLALAEYAAALNAGLRPLYVGFNRLAQPAMKLRPITAVSHGCIPHGVKENS